MKTLATMITQLEGLLGTNDLTGWETKFVRDVASRTAMARKMGTELGLVGGTRDKVLEIYERHFA